MVLPSLGAIIPTYFVPKLKISRKKLILIALAGRAVSFLVLYTNIKGVIICLICAGMFNFETGMLFGLNAPAIDDAEVKTHKRMDAMVFSMTNLAVKLASAIGGSIGLAIMGVMGYVANAEQTTTAMTGINIATNIVPAICCGLAMIPIMIFSLSEEKIKENSAILENRHAGQE